MPHLAFFALAGGVGGCWRRSTGRRRPTAAHAGDGSAAPPGRARKADGRRRSRRPRSSALLPVELLCLDVGLDLLAAASTRRAAASCSAASPRCASRWRWSWASSSRRSHVRDDLRLRPGALPRAHLRHSRSPTGEVRAGRLLAIDPTRPRDRRHPRRDDPRADLRPAREVDLRRRSRARRGRRLHRGRPSAVIATHLTEVVRRHAHELLGRREAQELLDLAAKTNAKVVEELIPHLMSLGEVIKVLRNLLAEGVSIRDIRTHPRGARRPRARR